MSDLNPLSGFDLVNKGITKNQATLPELGLKDVCPTGSWLEQKQIQAAVDDRKHLISAERIEKSCSLSHAEWRENLMLAEVTQKTGGHWQFMGHNVGKHLFLYPEEALFLMEINCLLLKHNDVKVSIQQAYSLLFRDNTSLTNYMVYAYLSRLGYKVLRHKDTKPKKNSNDQREMTQDDISIDNKEKEEVSDENEGINKFEEDIPMCETEKDTEADQNKECSESENQSNVILISSSDKNDSDMDISPMTCDEPDYDAERHKLNVYRRQIQRIKNRALKQSDTKILGKCFKSLTNVLPSQTVSVNVPQKEFVPENIEFAKAVYTLNLKDLKSKGGGRLASRSYSATDEASGSHVRRVRNVSEGSMRPITENSTNNTIVSPFERFLNRFPQMRPVNFLRPQQMTFFQPAMFYPRVFPQMAAPRLHFFPRWHNFYRPFFFETNPNPFVASYRKRSRDDSQIFNLESIKRLAARLKGLLRAGLPQTQSLDALNKLIETYNNRYKSSVRLTADYEIEDCVTVETIEIDDDENPVTKKPRLDNSYTENLEDIKRLAARLKELEDEGKTTAMHRRAFSSLLRTFNKSYNAEIYMNGDYVVSDKRHIILDSSSDSDCEIQEPSVSSVSGKKLRNPFNVLKRLSEKRTKSFTYSPSTSGENASSVDPAPKEHCNESLIKTMGDNWVPGRDDFGRPEIPASYARVYTDNSIYNYAKYHSCDWANWAELKTAFLISLEESAIKFVREEECLSIIKVEDCTDLATVMNKLSIIKNCDDSGDTTLSVAFDVYNRDVQNFRKTCPPTPHFRVLCFDQTSTLPTGEDIAGLYSKYADGVLMVFAVVHEGSISYLQIKNVNLPMYFSNINVTESN